MPVGPFDLLLALVVMLLPVWWRRAPRLTVATLAAVAFVWWCLASAVLWSIDMRRSVMSVFALMEACLVFVVCYNVFIATPYRSFESAVRLFGIVLSLQVLWAVWSTLTGGDSRYFYDLKHGAVVPLGASNFVAMFLEFGLVYEILKRRRWWMVVAALHAAALVLTFSRGAVVALGITLTVAWVSLLFTRGERRTAIVVACAAGLATAALWVWPFGRILLEAFTLVGRTASSRFELWGSALGAAEAAPLTGFGIGTFESIGGVRDAHSTIFELLGETGVVGLALFGVMIAGFLLGVARVAWAGSGSKGVRREALALTFAFGAVLLHSLIEPFFFDRSAPWVAVVLAWVMWVAVEAPGADARGRAAASSGGGAGAAPSAVRMDDGE
jgi:O-antigen ligase